MSLAKKGQQGNKELRGEKKKKTPLENIKGNQLLATKVRLAGGLLRCAGGPWLLSGPTNPSCSYGGPRVHLVTRETLPSLT